jgi:hypothetical protein
MIFALKITLRRFAIVSMLVYDSIFGSSDECGSRQLSDNLPYSYLKRCITLAACSNNPKIFKSWQT